MSARVCELCRHDISPSGSSILNRRTQQPAYPFQTATHVSVQFAESHICSLLPPHVVQSMWRVVNVGRSWQRRGLASLQTHNSVSGRKEALPLPVTRPLTWYICGPTVYDCAHLGHARTYVSFDIIHRLLTDHFRVPVSMAMGVTDIDDKIIDRASAAGVDFRAWARYYEQDFATDMRALAVRPAVEFMRC
jgi:hypothetical protein